jgi:hypothetical protein
MYERKEDKQTHLHDDIFLERVTVRLCWQWRKNGRDFCRRIEELNCKILGACSIRAAGIVASQVCFISKLLGAIASGALPRPDRIFVGKIRHAWKDSKDEAEDQEPHHKDVRGMSLRAGHASAELITTWAAVL